MSIKFRCPHCNHGIKAPDNAAGRAVRCPQCGEKARVPQPGQKARSEKKAKQKKEPAPGDSSDFLANIDLGNADAGVELCQKCAAEIPPGETTCPECGFDPSELTVAGMKRKKMAAKGIDPDSYYENLWSEPFRFALAHAGLLFRTGWILTFYFLLTAFCGYFLIWVATGPPFGFWVLLTTVSLMIPNGWLLIQHLEIIRLTIQKKDKVKKIRFDFAACSMTGMKLVVWVFIYGLPFWLLFGGLGILLDMSGISVGVPIGFSIAALCVLIFTPQAMSHLAMPVESPGWYFPKIAKTLSLTFLPGLLWAVLFILVNIPVLGGVAVVYFVGGDKFEEFVDVRLEQAKIHMGRVEIKLAESSGDEGRIATTREKWGEVAARDNPSQDFSQIVLPVAIGVISCFLLSFSSLVVARANGLFTSNLRKGLHLIAAEKEVQYVSKKKEEKIRTRKTTMPAPAMLKFLACTIDLILLVILNSTVGGMVYYVVASFDVDFSSNTARLVTYVVMYVMASITIGGYFVTNEASIEQTTPGKSIFKMFVAADERCQPISMSQALIRFLSFWFLSNGLTFFIGNLLGAIRKDGKTLHDLLSNTEVRMDKPKPKDKKEDAQKK